jgi:hypothetical protein
MQYFLGEDFVTSFMEVQLKIMAQVLIKEYWVVKVHFVLVNDDKAKKLNQQRLGRFRV